MELRSGTVLRRANLSEGDFEPTIAWWGQMRLYLSPSPIHCKGPSLKNLPCVSLKQMSDLEVHLDSWKFTVSVFTNLQETYMTYNMARRLTLNRRVQYYNPVNFNTRSGPVRRNVAYTDEVLLEVAENEEATLRTRIGILPYIEAEDENCYIGRQTLADNNVIQEFGEGFSNLYFQRGGDGSRKKGGYCYLQAHFHPSLLDPAKSVLLCNVLDESYIGGRSVEVYNVCKCVHQMDEVMIPLERSELRIPIKCSAAFDDSIFMILGVRVLKETNALLDHSTGALYLKVDGRRYKIQMTCKFDQETPFSSEVDEQERQRAVMKEGLMENARLGLVTDEVEETLPVETSKKERDATTAKKKRMAKKKKKSVKEKKKKKRAHSDERLQAKETSQKKRRNEQ